jgi:hypothetical protein
MKLVIKILLSPFVIVMLPVALTVVAFDVAKAFVEYHLESIL